MSAEAAFLRQQVQRLNAVLNQYQVKYLVPPASTPAGVFGEGDPPAPWLTDKSLLAPLIAEYDRHLEEMEGQLRNYQNLMDEMKLKMKRVVVENERLHAELRKSVETQLDGAATSLGVFTSDLTEEGMAKNLQEQVQLANQEKEQALQMWRMTSEELEQLSELYQEHVGDVQLHLQERQHHKEHLVEVQQFSQQLQVAKQRLETSNQQLAKTLGDQNVELNQLRIQLRQAKMELRTSDAKSEELGRAMQSLREELLKKEEEDTAMRGQEQATERRSQQMRKTVTQLDAR
uniref:Sodium channel and clathrin linker 1 n=1 Tax=Petromyzon marinus TaxID=7757 RepID=S4RA20_PETMA